MRLQSGQAGENAARNWFERNGWNMVRTQPAVQILGVAPGRRYGTVFTCRMVASGGVPDYTGFVHVGVADIPEYRACEVKEASGDSMPASRLDKEQRAFMSRIPFGCAHVGILWTDTGKFEMYQFIEKGSYKR